MANETKKTTQQARELANEKDEAHTGQSGAQSGNPGMRQKQGAKGDASPNPDDVAPTRDPITETDADIASDK